MHGGIGGSNPQAQKHRAKSNEFAVTQLLTLFIYVDIGVKKSVFSFIFNWFEIFFTLLL